MKGAIFDVDGVVWAGGRTFPDVCSLKKLRDRGVKVAFLSNNCSISEEKFKKRLLETGVGEEGDIFINTHLLAREYVRRFRSGKGFYVLGCEELAAEVGKKPYNGVIVGLDREVTYEKFNTALQILLSGGEFIACNLDPTLPWKEGYKPGAGCCVAFLKEASGKDFVLLGKPSPFASLLLKEVAPGVKWVMVGDRHDTDGYFAKNSGIPFLYLRRKGDWESTTVANLKVTSLEEAVAAVINDNV